MPWPSKTGDPRIRSEKTISLDSLRLEGLEIHSWIHVMKHIHHMHSLAMFININLNMCTNS